MRTDSVRQSSLPPRLDMAVVSVLVRIQLARVQNGVAPILRFLLRHNPPYPVIPPPPLLPPPPPLLPPPPPHSHAHARAQKVIIFSLRINIFIFRLVHRNTKHLVGRQELHELGATDASPDTPPPPPHPPGGPHRHPSVLHPVQEIRPIRKKVKVNSFDWV